MEENCGVDSKTNSLRMPELWCNEVYYGYMNSLNRGQQTIVHNIHGRIQRGINFHIFLTGVGGTGKSRVLKAVYQTVSRFQNPRPELDIEPKFPVIIGAYTGKAAHNVGGQTIHTLFSFQRGSYREMSQESLRKFGKKFAHTVLVIIDEISLCGYRSYSNMMKRIIQFFGIKSMENLKISFLVVGDFRQLKPVGDQWIFQRPIRSETVLEGVVGNFFWPEFELFELDEIMRQRDDLTFARLLTTIGELGVEFCTEDEKSLLNSRIVDQNAIPIEAMILTYSNDRVDEFNHERLLQFEHFRQKAFDFAVGKDSGSELARKVCSGCNTMTYLETSNLRPWINLVIGKKYMIHTNINTSDGLVNGTIGTLMQIVYNEYQERYFLILYLFIY